MGGSEDQPPRLPSINLSNITYSSVLPQLYLPVPSAPSDVGPTPASEALSTGQQQAVDLDKPLDQDTLRKVAGLLAQADVSYVVPRAPALQQQQQPSVYSSTVGKQLLAVSPGIFDATPDAAAPAVLAASPAAAGAAGQTPATASKAGATAAGTASKTGGTAAGTASKAGGAAAGTTGKAIGAAVNTPALVVAGRPAQLLSEASGSGSLSAGGRSSRKRARPADFATPPQLPGGQAGGGVSQRRRLGGMRPMMQVDTPAAGKEELVASFLSAFDWLSAGNDSGGGGRKANGKAPCRRAAEDEEEGDDDDDAGGGGVPEFLTLKQTKTLGDEVLRLRVAGALPLLPVEVVTQLMRVLGRQIEYGQGRQVPLDADESSDAYLSVMESLEATSACLQLMGTPGMPRQAVAREDIAESALGFLRYTLQHNVYAVYDLQYRQLYRVAASGGGSSDEDGEDGVEDKGSGKPGRGRGGGRAGGKGRGGRGGSSTAKKTKTPRTGSTAAATAAVTGVKPTAAHRSVLSRTEAALSLVADACSAVKLQHSCLLPLLRAALQSLSVASPALGGLRATAVRTVAAAFREAPPQQRSAVFEEALGALLPAVATGRSPAKSYVAGGEEGTCVQPATALLLLLVQGCVSLPSHADAEEVEEAEGAALAASYKQALYWSDVFWQHCAERLPTARGPSRADAEVDVRGAMEQVVADLLAVHCLPEWPSAPTLLLRCCSVLAGPRGLQHADPGPRQAGVDLLGQVLAAFWREGAAAERDAAWVADMLREHGYLVKASDGEEGEEQEQLPPATVAAAALQRLVMDYLGNALAGAGGGEGCTDVNGDVAAGALEHWAVLSFVEDVIAAQKNLAPREELLKLLVDARQLLRGCGNPSLQSLPRADVLRLAAAQVQHGPLGRARTTRLKALLEAADQQKQNATTRSKAIKALGLVIEADTRALGLKDVQAGVQAALQDEAISVREAAVDLLGRHIGSSEQLALEYLDTLGRAASDPGTSVRKRALRILADACIRRPGFLRATDACAHVLMRAGDPEDSIQALVAGVFCELWFAPSGGDEAAAGLAQRTSAERAEQLAGVGMRVYESAAVSRSIGLPLAGDHKLVVVLRAALGAAGEGAAAVKAVQRGRQLSSTLLERLLQVAEEGAGVDDLAAFPYLLALHALCVADPQLCIPGSDAQRFVRCLAPHLKVSPPASDGTAQSADRQRRSAEQLMCVVSVLDDLLGSLGGGGGGSLPLAEMVSDLVRLVCHHLFVQVVAAACKCLCTVAQHDAQAAGVLAHRAQVSHTTLVHVRAQDVTRLSPAEVQTARAHAARYLYILGQLCRYGADIIEGDSCSEVEHPSMKDVMDVCMAYLQSNALGPKVQESALQAAGLLFVSRPNFMLLPAAAPAVKGALAVSAPPSFKTRALANLAELLKAESDRLVSKQREASEAAQRVAHSGAIPGITVAVAGAGGGQQGSLAVVNGEGDALSLASSILQDNWDLVLALAVDTSRPPPPRPGTASTPSAARGGGSDLGSNAVVRCRAVELMEAVLRDGLVAPWTAIPALVALLADANEEVSQRALRLLRREAEKHPALFDGRLGPGVQQAYRFQMRLMAEEYGGGGGGKLPKALRDTALKGLCGLYANVVQPKPAGRHNFLTVLLKPLDAGSCLNTKGAANADLGLLAFCTHVAAALPFKRGDEPCTLVHIINGIVARRGESVLASLKAAVTAPTEQQQQQQAGASAATLPTAAANGAGGKSANGVSPDGMDTPKASSSAKAVPASAAQAKAECSASLALSMLLLLKKHTILSYGLTPDRILAFAPSGDKRRQEERTPASRAPGVAADSLPVDKLRLDAPGHAEKTWEQYKVFKALMKGDSNDYSEQMFASTKKGGRAGGGRGAAAQQQQAAVGGGEGAGSGEAEAGDTPRATGAGGKPTGRGRGGRGRSKGGGGGGRGRGMKRDDACRGSDGGGGGSSPEEEVMPTRKSRGGAAAKGAGLKRRLAG